MAGDPPKGRKVSKKRALRNLELRVVLDTNQLYTGSASDLVRQEVAELAQECRRHQDVVIRWYIPDVVRLERRYQMLEAAQKLLPSVQRLERLLGHGLAISEEILADRVSSAIERQLATLDLQVLPLDPGRVDWPRLIEDAAGRRPPFQAGEHEKGFRDALILETVVQLIDDSPKSPKACRIALVTADGLLASTVEAQTKDAGNVRILRSLDELRDLVNTIVADVTEDFVNAIREVAQACFFVKDDEDSLYYSAKVYDQIASRFATELGGKPLGADARRNVAVNIGPPRFSKKNRQRVHWVSTIRVSAKALRDETPAGSEPGRMGDIIFSTSSSSPDAVFLSALQGLYSKAQPSIHEFYSDVWKDMPAMRALTAFGSGTRGGSAVGQPGVRTHDVVVAQGESVFEVSWTATVTSRKKLVHPVVDDIRHVETTWTVGSSG